MLVRLLYASRATAPLIASVQDSILEQSRAHNPKLGITGIVFACDTEPVVVTKSPHDWVTLRPRRIELDNVGESRSTAGARILTRRPRSSSNAVIFTTPPRAVRYGTRRSRDRGHCANR